MKRLGVFPLLAMWSTLACAQPTAEVARYDHILVIIEENKDYGQIMNPASAPNIAGLAAQYGNATQFFGEVHPSEANYVALLAGDTFGIHDDDAFYCRQGSTRPHCEGARTPGYADHTIAARHLGDQIVAANRTWKGYYGSLPEPGSDAVIAGDPRYPEAGANAAFYASKHSGFMNFADVQSDPRRAEHIVAIEQLDTDLDRNTLPSFALVVPNQCDEMHGLKGSGLPQGCDGDDPAALIRRGDTYTGVLVRKIQASPAWRGRGNVAIVITFDEGTGHAREGCCAAVQTPGSELGGGHIPTIVITNHGARGVRDDTPYNHYSLLRTIEDALGLPDHLGHAADSAQGVVSMTRLFAVGK